jgi:hypothetical protein
LHLNPAVVTNVGTVCVGAGGVGVGVIDCDGGRANLNATLSRDHNTTPKICLGGTNVGASCTKNSNCPSGTCYAGTNAGGACTSNGDCPGGTCAMGCNLNNSGSANGLPDDATCTATALQPDGSISYACKEGTKQCAGGPNEGALCTQDSDCPTSTCTFCNIGTNGGPHPAVCNSPQVVVQSGTFAAGDVAVSLPLSLTILSQPAPTPPADYGADHLPCTVDDTAAPEPPVTVTLSTGTNSINVYDVGNTAGAKISPTSSCAGQPCVAQITGQGLSCPNLVGGNVSGLKFGGGFPAVDSPAGDIATVFQFTAQ